MPSLEQIAMRRADRGFITGKNGYGKSTLARFLLEHWQRVYCKPRTPPSRRGRLLVADTKPRWRATHAVTGRSIQRRYRYMAPGDTIRGVVLSNLADWDLVWDPRLNPEQTVILQNLELPDDLNVLWQVRAIEKFFNTQRFKRPSLLYVDEGMDFFGPTGNGRYGNAVQRCYRAGRERGMATLLGAQRPKSINMQTLTESNVLYVFHLDFDGDLKRLVEVGYPPKLPTPAAKYEFRYLRDGRIHPRPLYLPKGAL